MGKQAHVGCRARSSPRGTRGNIVRPGVNELVIPVCKQAWADIRKISDTPMVARGISFKSKEYKL